MTPTAEPRLLIMETSGRTGQVAVAQGARVMQLRRLDETRRHARDLAPAVAELLAAANWKPRAVQGLIVSRGPGSYTGLRVGIMAAKVFAYATGAALLAVDTFSAIAFQAGPAVDRLDVLADAQQDKVYVQRFGRSEAATALLPVTPLTIRSLADWLAEHDSETWVSGPGLIRYGERLPAGMRLVNAVDWDPQVDSLLRLGLTKYQSGDRADPWTLEPLYLRASAAEEKWQGRPSP